MPFPFTDSHPKFRIPGWSELLGEDECMAAPEMARHFLITGETGSGKSVSAVMRLLEAILRYPEKDLYKAYAREVGKSAEPESQLRPSILVADPKEELEAIVEKEARGRRVVRVRYGTAGPVLHLFEGRDLARMDAFEALNLILQHSDYYVLDQARTREPIWNMQAAAMLRDFVATEMFLHRREPGSVVTLWKHISEALGQHLCYRNFTSSLRYNAENYFKPHSTLLSLCGNEDQYPLEAYIAAASLMKVPGDLYAKLVSVNQLYHSTRSGVIWMTNGILADMAADEFAASVSVNPLEPPAPKRRLSVTDALNGGDLVIYTPVSGSPIADMVGRCLKAKFFEFAFNRENKVRPFFYVVDEAHRFITAGAEDGEQSLLDRCRAYRTGVVMATQSIASIAYRLESQGNGGKNLLQMILNNCGNAMYFRTPDIQTHENLQQRIPGPPVPNRPHVLKVRPLTSLGVGNCYALRCNGTWGLFQVRLPRAA